jgi:two-component system chemotaxis response regulator CheY
MKVTWNASNTKRYLFQTGSKAAFAHIPILVVTTRNTQQDVITAIKAGANNYVVKPFGPTQLSDKIEKVLNSI